MLKPRRVTLDDVPTVYKQMDSGNKDQDRIIKTFVETRFTKQSPGPHTGPALTVL
jgi:hypothetical protein